MKTPLVERFGNESRWVNWRLETVDGRVTKVPYSVANVKASSTDPPTWSNYDSASLASNKIGIIFTPDKKLLGIDLDHFFRDGCLVGDNRELVADIITEADTYTEISPSGEGFHLFLEVAEPFSPVANKKDMVDSDGVKRGYECYTSGRFFTVTGVPYGEVRPIRVVSVPEANRLLSLIGYPWGRDKVNNIEKASTEELANDEQVLERMFCSANGEAAERLYNGDITQNDNDHSSADMSLCSRLSFWTGRNATQIERIWLGSPLGKREKTQKRKDYRERTIKNAISKCEDVYPWPVVKKGAETSEIVLTKPVIKESEGLVLLSDLAVPVYENQWIWNGYLSRSKITMLFATWKAGKTTFYTHLLRSIERGDVFVGSETKKTKVLIISEEDPQTWVQRRDAYSFGTTIFLQSQPFNTRPTSKEWSEYMSRMATLCVENEIALVVIDTLANLWPVDNENDAAKVVEGLQPLREFTKKNIAILAIHHPKKEFDNIDNAMRGSGAFGGFCDAYMGLSRVKGNDKQREMNIRGRTGFSKEKTIVELIDLDKKTENYIKVGTAGEVSAVNGKEIVMEVLRISTTAFSIKEIREECNIMHDEEDGARKLSETQVWRIVTELVEEGKVEETIQDKQGRGKKGRLYQLKNNNLFNDGFH